MKEDELSYLWKKRFKLLTSIIIISIAIFLISFFVHNLMLSPYTKSQTEILSTWYREEIYREIKEEMHTDEEVKLLWNIVDRDVIKKIDIYELLDYYRIFYIAIAVFMVILTAIFTKWFMTNTNDIFISDELKKGKDK